MRRWIRGVLLAPSLAPFFAGVWVATEAAAKDSTVQFQFIDAKSRAALLKGEEQVGRDGDFVVKHTVYKNAKDEVAQTEDVRYEAATLRLDFYRFDDKLSGETAELHVQNGKAAAQYRADKDAAVKTAAFDWEPGSLSGKSVPDLVLHNWDKVMAGESLDFELYVPFRLETIGFHAVKQSGGAGGPATVLVEPRNWLVRAVAPSIEFDFEGSPPQLVRYKGPSMVDIGGEKNRAVEITFKPVP